MLNKAYIAGIIDGEGCVSLTGRFDRHGIKKYVTPIIQVANTNFALIELLQKQFG